MSEAPLLKNFDLLATAPGGVARLRELILTLAVQGKLVPQAQADESASRLVQSIQVAKNRCLDGDSHRRRKSSQTDQGSKKPFDIPANWQWSKGRDLYEVIRGVTYQKSDARDTATATHLPILRANNIRSVVNFDDLVHVPSRLVSPEQKLREGDYVVCLASGSKHLVGKAAPFPGELECSFGAFCGAIRPWMALPFIAVFLASPLYRNAVSFASAGIGINNLKSTSLLELDIPVPPLAEQNRIVTQVEELMKLCDALELNGRLADEQHARITSTLFDALTASESAHALAENWERVAENFDLLLDRAEAVISLERVVLELAVRGLLVPQVKSDEPAGAILHRVQQRTRTKSIKDKPQPGSVDDIAPYVLPKGWEWIRLGDLVEDMGSGWSPACDEGERSDVERWAVLRTTAVQVMEYRAREHKAIPLKFPPRPEIEVKNGDILLTRAGPMNRVGISCWVHDTPPRLILSDKIIRFHSIGDEMLPEYVVMTLNAGWTKNLIDSAKSGMAASQVNISQSDVRSLFIPVCSRSEQVRVTQRVKQLRELCSRLSERIRMRQGTQNSLAEALVDAPHTV